MELWIRSQDKESLVRPDYKLMITNVPTQNYSGREGYRITSDFYVIGIYKTKERALEVLNEIQRIFYNNQKYINNVVVYEMPEK